MELLDQFGTVLTLLIIGVGIIAVVVSVITEALKFIPTINKLPTKLVVLLVSVVITPVCITAFMAWLQQPIEWYVVFASFIAAFFIALVSMNGWEAISDIVKRCIKKED